jgi:hypothetical protein
MVPVKYYSFHTEQVSQVAVIEKLACGINVCFTIIHDGSRVAWKPKNCSESNLMLIESFR